MAKLTSTTANEILSYLAQLYAVGIDIGSEKCSFSVLKSDKTVVIKPMEMTNDNTGIVRLRSGREQFVRYSH